MKNVLFRTGDHLSGPILRLTIFIAILPHGLQLAFGWLGGSGYSATMEYLHGSMHLPVIIAFLTIALQVIGPLALLVGFASRLFAFAMTILFIGMILTAHLHNGFFMNWLGNQPGEGFEYHLLVIGILCGILVSGAGKYAVDRLLSND
ncbi:DoxX family protein [Chitinophaga pendula]|uniref:DoxX family protein n=1 Tax=Chitinophaga TaxID=79328 RepID=UPI000BB065A6|nr:MULTISPECIES: DoxX family protein [Chitinophaga]ASZ10914.1 hypothetical protein CK934_07965 [Chitinophaga sp. MD30]UCJ06098.1 DoxX family protein [Chitinophaga pendula]